MDGMVCLEKIDMKKTGRKIAITVSVLAIIHSASFHLPHLEPVHMVENYPG